MRFEDLFGETGSDLADRLELFGVGVEAREEERPVDVGSLAATVVGSDDDEVEGISDAGEVVLLELGEAGTDKRWPSVV